MPTLVLWDVDQTLVRIKGLSKEVYEEVFERLTGRPLEHLADMAGRTDLAIAADTLRLHGIAPDEEAVRELLGGFAEAYCARHAEVAERGTALPGARAALEALADRDDVVQALLTGNVEATARCKLAAFGLDAYVDFTIGAYGDDDTERPPLVKLARKRAEQRHGHPFTPTSTVVVGDTPHDVRAGHEGGARVVAVATGFSDEATLRAAGADLVLPDLTDTPTVLRSVLRPAGR